MAPRAATWENRTDEKADPLLIGIAAGAAVAIVAVTAIVVYARRRRARRLRRQAVLDRADERLAAWARGHGWRCAIRPSSSIWYRLSGEADDVAWEMIEAAPDVVDDQAAGPGPRWSTDAMRSPQLLFEVLPVGRYQRLKRALESGSDSFPDSAATRNLIQNGRPVVLGESALASRSIIIAVTPGMAERLLASDVERALAAIQSPSLRVSFGFPNLRIAIGESGPSDRMKAIVDAGLLIVQRYRWSDAGL